MSMGVQDNSLGVIISELMHPKIQEVYSENRSTDNVHLRALWVNKRRRSSSKTREPRPLRHYGG